MRLVGPDGQSLELTLEGYQFPHLAVADYDLNWLVVRVDVSHPRGAWQASDAALLTYEVARLANWLESVAAGRESCPSEEFMEPNLEFRLLPGVQGRTLRVLFGLELRPRWANSDVAATGEVSVDFPLASLDLRVAAEDLRQQLQRFPQRAAM